MPEVWFAVPGDPGTLTGGYVYARRLAEALTAAGWNVHRVRLPDGLPSPTTGDLQAVQRLFAAIPAGSPVLVDGLAFGALPRRLLDGLALRWVALVHHPLALETGLGAAESKRLRESERVALAAARAVVATSHHTTEALVRDYDVSPQRLHVALPGTDPGARARGSDGVPRLLTVATLTRRKGHDVLVRALSVIEDIPWTSVMVGSVTRDRCVVDEVRALIGACGLDGRIVLVGELHGAALEAAYAAADLFVLSSRHEGYGMVFAEALTHGLPVVACAAGAVRATVPSDSGILVPVDDVEALSAALRRLLSDRALRCRLAEAAWARGRRLPGWADTAAKVATALRMATAP